MIFALTQIFEKLEREGKIGTDQHVENFVEFAKLIVCGCKSMLGKEGEGEGGREKGREGRERRGNREGEERKRRGKLIYKHIR